MIKYMERDSEVWAKELWARKSERRRREREDHRTWQQERYFFWRSHYSSRSGSNDNIRMGVEEPLEDFESSRYGYRFKSRILVIPDRTSSDVSGPYQPSTSYCSQQSDSKYGPSPTGDRHSSERGVEYPLEDWTRRYIESNIFRSRWRPTRAAIQLYLDAKAGKQRQAELLEKAERDKLQAIAAEVAQQKEEAERKEIERLDPEERGRLFTPRTAQDWVKEYTDQSNSDSLRLVKGPRIAIRSRPGQTPNQPNTPAKDSDDEEDNSGDEKGKEKDGKNSLRFHTHFES